MFRRSACWALLHHYEAWGHQSNNTNRVQKMQMDLRTDVARMNQTVSQQTPFNKVDAHFAKGEVREMNVPHWQQQTRPTHFFSLRIPASSPVTAQVRGLHSITERDLPQYLPLLTPIKKLHLTLTLLTIPGEEKGEQEALPNVKEAMEKIFNDTHPFVLRFHGLGVFGGGRVVFARVQSEHDSYLLDQKVVDLRKELAFKHHLQIKGNPHDNYTPHATVAKLSPKAKKALGNEHIRVVPRELYDPYAYEDFGTTVLPTIDFCSIKGEGEDGYYRTLLSKTLGEGA